MRAMSQPVKTVPPRITTRAPSPGGAGQLPASPVLVHVRWPLARRKLLVPGRRRLSILHARSAGIGSLNRPDGTFAARAHPLLEHEGTGPAQGDEDCNQEPYGKSVPDGHRTVALVPRWERQRNGAGVAPGASAFVMHLHHDGAISGHQRGCPQIPLGSTPEFRAEVDDSHRPVPPGDEQDVLLLGRHVGRDASDRAVFARQATEWM